MDVENAALDAKALAGGFEPLARNLEKTWWLYIARCREGELYVGIAQDVQERISHHNRGLACRYTKYRRPVRLLYEEECGDYASARKRERQVKKYSRAKKLALMSGAKISPPFAGFEIRKNR